MAVIKEVSTKELRYRQRRVHWSIIIGVVTGLGAIAPILQYEMLVLIIYQ